MWRIAAFRKEILWQEDIGNCVNKKFLSVKWYFFVPKRKSLYWKLPLFLNIIYVLYYLYSTYITHLYLESSDIISHNDIDPYIINMIIQKYFRRLKDGSVCRITAKRPINSARFSPSSPTGRGRSRSKEESIVYENGSKCGSALCISSSAAATFLRPFNSAAWRRERVRKRERKKGLERHVVCRTW